ncbi:DUF3302 domain-containing protein [Shimia sp.]|uniref:DUF3302 domain-containing protein n=1 Tax=Shimia sp. TaxID=1954381 RepID=UPI003296E1B1
MSGLDIFAWVVLIVLIFTVIGIFVFLAMLPGRIAKGRNHPQSEAVNVAGWLGALALGVFWPLALVWAFYVYPGQKLAIEPEGNAA